MPTGHLHLYRFIEDAWSGALSAWCRESAPDDSWILAENPGQTRWLLRKFAAESITGIRIFDPDSLREELARLAGLDPLPRHLAAAAFAVKFAAHPDKSETAQFAARNASAVAEAADALARAGWHFNQLTLNEAVSRRLHRIMDAAALLSGIQERRLREALPPLPVRLCCIGWDATHWPDLGLLDLAASRARSCDLFVPSPRLPADALQREWIDALEQRLGLRRLTCPEGGFASENEPLVSCLENSELASRAEARSPLLLVGREWPDQIRLVCDQVAQWLPGLSVSADPIGIIAPEDSATAVAIAEALKKSGIPVEHPGRIREPSASVLILEQVARYHMSGHDIDALIDLADLLWFHAREHWAALDPESVRDALNRAFQYVQSRNARILAHSTPYRKVTTWTTITELVEALGQWESDLAGPALQEKWTALLSTLHLPTFSFSLSPLAFPSSAFSPRSFMEWLADECAALRRLSAPAPDFSSLAPVVITAFANAAQQTWSHLIFLDSNENVWPAPFAENPFLPDATRLRLNGNRRDSARLLTTRDLRSLDQSRFLDLVEHCRAPVAFAGVLVEQTDSGDRLQPNDWVMRALIETAAPGEPFPINLWTDAARAFPPAPSPPLDEPERAHLQRVHSSRHNGTIPFDRYLFNYHESKIEPGAWSATRLDDVIIRPATFALRELFGAESIVNGAFAREEGAAVGNRAHLWLSRILRLTDRLAPPAPASDDAGLAREHAAAGRELEEWYAAESLPLPIWWETCLRKTAWATRRCLREVRRHIASQCCSMEQRLAVTVQTPAGPLLLKGRIDILISDRPELPGAHVRIFDFKTGRSPAPTLSSLKKGYGAQFAAYYLMARDAGAASVIVGIIKPESPAKDAFTAADESPLRDFFHAHAALRGKLRFGMRGPLRSDHTPCETLPLATVPIDPAILDQKASLFLLA